MNYSIKWEGKYYDIRSGFIGQAYFNGPKKTGDWNLDIVSGESLGIASVHRAAHRYYNKNVGNLIRPIFLAGGKIKLSYFHREASAEINGDFNSYFGGLVFPNIRLFGENVNGGRSTDRLFSTTAHELTHAAHFIRIGNIRFWKVDKIIVESWAEACERSITTIEYEELGDTAYVHHEFLHYLQGILLKIIHLMLLK